MIETIPALTDEQRQALFAEFQEQQKEAEKAQTEARETYKRLIEDELHEVVPMLAEFGTKQNEVVAEMFKRFAHVLQLKEELYGKKDTQGSHTFSSRDGNLRLVIGYNETIGFDGTESEGVTKIKAFIASLGANDEKRQTLAELLNTFMKPDKKGNLNPTRIAELVNQRERINDPEFHDGIDIIVRSQFKTRTSQYVRGYKRYYDEAGKEVKMNFSITSN